MPVFTIKKDGNIIVNVDRLEIYIPKDLFDAERIDKDVEHAAVATSFGDGFKIMAIMNARVAVKPEDKIEDSKLYTFNYPQMIITYPTSSSDERLSLYKDSEPEDYKVLKYVQGDILMSAQIQKNADNCVKFLNVLTKGKIPRTIKYEDIFLLWKKNLEINDVNPGVPDVYLQFIISEIYRDKNNPAKKFRFIYGKDMTKNDYQPSNMRGVVASSSVFSSQIFEHMSRMLTTSINMSRRGLKQERSPIEKVLWL